jgi:hypothetical protein
VFSNKRTRSIIGGTINSSAKIMMRARTLTRGLCAVMRSAWRACVGIAFPGSRIYPSKRENRLGQIVKI